jgi:beta-lactamase class A
MVRSNLVHERMNRRLILLQLLAAAVLPPSRARAGAVDAPSTALSQAIALLEAHAGGRLGAVVLDEKGVRANHRGDERFALCSTFKLALAANILSRVDQGIEDPARRIESGEGALPILDLCRAVVVRSDNAAANALLNSCGGPGAVTAFLRATGDHFTRLDRFEPDLNRVDIAAGDMRDTTTPLAMASTLQRLLLGSVLSPASRAQAIQWMRESTTGLTRLRAGIPPAWMAGDKTGTGPDGPTNDIAIAWPPGRPPLLIAVYFERTGYPAEDNARVLAEVGAMIGGARFSDSIAKPAAAL